MAIVSFWSDGTKETGKTASIAAISTYLAINTTHKMLVFNTVHNDATINECFWPQQKESNFNFKLQNKTDLDTGISGVAKAILSNKTSPEIITNYTKTVFKGRLEILTEKEISQEEYSKQRRTFKELVKMANKYYELVFVDLSEVENDNIEREILEISNVIVVNLNQSIQSFNKYLNLRKNGMFFEKNNLILLLGKSDKDSKYNAKNLARNIKEKDVFSIPYATAFYEATTEGTVAEYFMKFRKKAYPDENTEFVESVKAVSERILSKIKELQMM